VASATSAGHTLPYLTANGEPLLILSSDDDFAPRSKSSKVSARDNFRLVSCGFGGCDEKFPAASIRQHVAYHLLHDDKAQLVSPCGLCGVNPQAQYGNPDLGCSVWLAKDPKGTTLKPHHICRVVGHVEYSNSCAKKFSQGQPSTNHLIACPQCPQRPMQQFFWKYRGMKEHFDRAHASFAMPSDLKQLLEIEDKERNELKKFSKAKGPSRAKKRKKKEVNKAAKRMKAKHKPLPRGAAPSDIESDEEPQPTAPSTGNVEIPAGPA
jgi:hypothetical protein